MLKDEGVFHFLLACYECQIGNVDAAKRELKSAFKLIKGSARVCFMKLIWSPCGIDLGISDDEAE